MTTTPTASPDLLDLDRLEALARAATPGEWIAKPHGRIVGGPLRHYVNGSAQQQLAMLNVTIHDQDDEDVPDRQQANTEFIAGANPAAVLALIALARRAQPEGEAPQADALYKQYWAQWPPLCGAQHAESGKEAAAAMRVIGGQRWSKEAEMTEGWLAAQQAAAPGALAAQEQASTTHVTETKRAQLEARGYEVVGYVMQNSVNELCTLAHGRVEWLGKGTTSAPGTPEAPADRHPVQPLIEDEHGRARFKENAIVRHLCEGKLNELAVLGFPEADWEQFAQLIGYSLDGFGTLSYVTDETYDRAAAQPVLLRAAQLDGGQEGSESNG